MVAGGVGGSAVITVLAIGLVMKSFADFGTFLGSFVVMPVVSLNYITAFQSETSFFLSASGSRCRSASS